eukprot:m.109541 g.109541  ORF g.109541 m.109541 type:complete len:927 (+) comp13376_c0_seq2:174-2954(+)
MAYQNASAISPGRRRGPEEHDHHPEISLPTEFEHFLHVGVDNLEEVNDLCKDQQKVFHQVVEKRTRKLPRPPKQAVQDAPSAATSPRSVSPSASVGTPARSTQSPSRPHSAVFTSKQTKTLRSFLRGDTPRKKRHEASPSLVEQAVEAVEKSNIELLNSLLEAQAVDANQLDIDGHTLLDLAVMLNHKGCIRLLQLFGGVETEAYSDPSVRSRRLEVVLRAKQIALGHIVDEIQAGGKNLYQEHEQNKQQCARAEMIYRSWTRLFQKAGLPSAPTNVKLCAASPTAITITLGDVLDHGGAVVTKYQIQWSASPKFESYNRLEIPAVTTEFTLEGLPDGQPCYVRVASVNIKGAGPGVQSVPSFLVPSSWNELSSAPSRVPTLESELDTIETDLELAGLAPESQMVKKAKSKFGSGAKLTKPSKRGLYLACCWYDMHAPERVIASGSTLPMVLVDEELSDIAETVQFIQLLSYCWSFSKSMASLATDQATLAKRRRVAEAASFLQHVLNTTDLGLLYFQPITEESGATILVAVQGVNAADVRMRDGGFTTIASLQSKRTNLGSGLSDIVDFGRACDNPIASGLYVGLVHPHTSLSGLRLTVPKACPNMVPFELIRSVSHISRDEWHFIKTHDGTHQRKGTATHGSDLAQKLVASSTKLVQSIGAPKEEAVSFQVYDHEVIEVRSDLSIIMLLPQEDYAMTAQAHVKPPTRAHETLALRSMELFFWFRFQPEITRQYARLYLYTDNQMKQLAYELRLAIGAEATPISHNLKFITECFEKLNATWRAAQFLADVVGSFRASSRSGVPLGDLKKSVRQAPLVPSKRGAASPLVRRRLTINTRGKSLLTVYLRSTHSDDVLIRHTLELSPYSTSKEVVKVMTRELKEVDEEHGYCLCLVNPSGEQQRIADECRPVLLQETWREDNLRLVLV